MARYPHRSYRRRRGRIRRPLYVISALVIIVVLMNFIYGYRSFGKNEDEAFESLVASDFEKQANLAVAGFPSPAANHEPERMLSEIIPESTSEPYPPAARCIDEALARINAKPAGIIEARDTLNEVLTIPMSEKQRVLVKKHLSELADKWLFGRTIFPEDKLCENYKVKPGDQLRIIGKRFKVPYEILMDINKISRPAELRAGEVIKVINGPFHARVYRSAFTMDLYLQNTFVRSFPVGLGKPGMETPTGLWLVKKDGKLIKPTWKDPISGKIFKAEDPEYPLGSRWIGLEGIKGNTKGRTGFAIHGTKDPDQIRAAGSQGCIRMHNDNAILMYNLLMPAVSQVEVVE